MTTRTLTRGALLIAVALVLQSLRLILPLPPLLNTLIVGSLVHMMLALILLFNGLKSAIILSLLLPVTAYFQGQLPLPLLIPVVWLGNTLFVSILSWLNWDRNWIYVVPTLTKAIVMGLLTLVLLAAVHLPAQGMGKAIMLGMTVMQLVTGVIGLVLAKMLTKRIMDRD